MISHTIIFPSEAGGDEDDLSDLSDDTLDEMEDEFDALFSDRTTPEEDDDEDVDYDRHDDVDEM